ncbi:Major Facilitator Superfamily [Dehalogenimonas alkenigignens]|uniref:Major Facilitator Superfamily n=1 Tax=Dehalogenimonas alkenigignens TaxID=1217799 RepID=A0A0W0GIP7_9CHLR|nr:MFS transporter [Dehalogenimonas alkenigignens]KTB48402.1 Major Facilitator Superfamily [Dehalogenimonas alkenigignens]
MKQYSPDPAVNKSLRYSVLDGASYNAMLGLTQDFMAPFALALKASTAQIGLLSSLPNLALALSQLGAPFISERLRSRKSLLVPLALAQAVLWLPLFLMPQLFHGAAVWWLIGLFTIGSVLGALGNPAWGGMMADLVPAGLRGRYFGWRNKIGGMTLLACFILGGASLQLSSSHVFFGFGLLFGAAAIFRLASAFFLSRMQEPPPRRCAEPWQPLREIKNISGTRAGRFSLFVAAMMLSTHLAGPFFAVYMLRELGFSYWTFVVVTAAAAVANFLFIGFWGRLADRIGHIKIVRLTAWLVPLNPILWLGGHSLPYLLVIQVFSGFSWSGFNLAAPNFLFEAAAPERRTRAIAIYNAASGLAICTGALLGGLIAPRMPDFFGHGFLTLFLLSGLARALASALLLPRVDDAKAADLKLSPSSPQFSPLPARLVPSPVELRLIETAAPFQPAAAGILTAAAVLPLEVKRPPEPYPPWPP